MLIVYLSVQEIRQMTLHLGVKHSKVLEVCTTKDVQTSKRWLHGFDFCYVLMVIFKRACMYFVFTEFSDDEGNLFQAETYKVSVISVALTKI
jgi:hypothetical protein